MSIGSRNTGKRLHVTPCKVETGRRIVLHYNAAETTNNFLIWQSSMPWCAVTRVLSLAMWLTQALYIRMAAPNIALPSIRCAILYINTKLLSRTLTTLNLYEQPHDTSMVASAALSILGLLALANARDIPDNVRKLYDSIVDQGRCNNELKGGFLSAEDGDDSKHQTLQPTNYIQSGSVILVPNTVNEHRLRILR